MSVGCFGAPRKVADALMMQFMSRCVRRDGREPLNLINKKLDHSAVLLGGLLCCFSKFRPLTWHNHRSTDVGTRMSYHAA